MQFYPSTHVKLYFIKKNYCNTFEVNAMKNNERLTCFCMCGLSFHLPICPLEASLSLISYLCQCAVNATPKPYHFYVQVQKQYSRNNNLYSLISLDKQSGSHSFVHFYIRLCCVVVTSSSFVRLC